MRTQGSTSDIRWLHLPASCHRPSAEFFCSPACPAARQCVQRCACMGGYGQVWVLSAEGHVQVRSIYRTHFVCFWFCAFFSCRSTNSIRSRPLFNFRFHIDALKMHMPWLLHIRHVLRSHLIFMKNRAESSNKAASKQTKKKTKKNAA